MVPLKGPTCFSFAMDDSSRIVVETNIRAVPAVTSRFAPVSVHRAWRFFCRSIWPLAERTRTKLARARVRTGSFPLYDGGKRRLLLSINHTSAPRPTRPIPREINTCRVSHVPGHVSQLATAQPAWPSESPRSAVAVLGGQWRPSPLMTLSLAEEGMADRTRVRECGGVVFGGASL